MTFSQDDLDLIADAVATKLNSSQEPEVDLLLTYEQVSERLSMDVSKVRRLSMFAPKLEPEEVANQFLKMQVTKIGREDRISERSYKAFLKASQGQKVATTAMTGKAKLHLAKAAA